VEFFEVEYKEFKSVHVQESRGGREQASSFKDTSFKWSDVCIFTAANPSLLCPP